ncbi:hypothetical protein B0H17DRAFT_1203117 [Mycena rosella]|uniref:Uncharacterized protein n=1 Tax=Mycena rosella TaxID=1033263 RepID=A0AAD7DBZ6_MYCRO|nr:hypothetical protein B0H17DRAFT_1203117 [Mycena rosella]
MVTSYYDGVCAETVRHQAYFLHSGLAIHADSRVALQSRDRAALLNYIDARTDAFIAQRLADAVAIPFISGNPAFRPLVLQMSTRSCRRGCHPWPHAHAGARLRAARARVFGHTVHKLKTDLIALMAKERVIHEKLVRSTLHYFCAFVLVLRPSRMLFLLAPPYACHRTPPFSTLPQRGRARPVVRKASRLYAVHLPAPTIQVLLRRMRLPLHGIERAVAGPYA